VHKSLEVKHYLVKANLGGGWQGWQGALRGWGVGEVRIPEGYNSECFLGVFLVLWVVLNNSILA